MLLGEQITAAEIARFDPDFARHRIAPLLREGGVAEMEEILCDSIYFVSVPEDAGVGVTPREEELVSGGRQIRVTELNKERCACSPGRPHAGVLRLLRGMGTRCDARPAAVSVVLHPSEYYCGLVLLRPSTTTP